MRKPWLADHVRGGEDQGIAGRGGDDGPAAGVGPLADQDDGAEQGGQSLGPGLVDIGRESRRPTGWIGGGGADGPGDRGPEDRHHAPAPWRTRA
jgi:hypothetical protein